MISSLPISLGALSRVFFESLMIRYIFFIILCETLFGFGLKLPHLLIDFDKLLLSYNQLGLLVKSENLHKIHPFPSVFWTESHRKVPFSVGEKSFTQVLYSKGKNFMQLGSRMFKKTNDIFEIPWYYRTYFIPPRQRRLTHMAQALDSKFNGRETNWVQVSLRAPYSFSRDIQMISLFL